ncbi:Gustatory receptor [Nesidiocoris tenuis]|uniref:Gustatory receptor n=1 Tax=Nesidiocoris tenuis TaxID=355587 RepID=A0ABN7AV01_9HEMI|nr:Gustatory receptor [Nesidiocoris tenuis]
MAETVRPVVREFLAGNSARAIAMRLTVSPRPRHRRHHSNEETVHCTLRPVLVVAQCITIMPIYGVLGKDHTQLRYSKYSLKTILSFAVTTVTCCLATLTTTVIWREGINYRVIGDVVLYVSSSLSMITFFYLANKWRSLMDEWAAVEEAMAGLPQVRVSRSIFVLTTYVVIASLCEHVLALLFNRDPCQIGMRKYYENSFRQIFGLTTFALWKGLIASFINFLVACTWNFTDLFLAALSIALSARFRRFSLKLESVVHKDKGLAYWMRIRELYNKLVFLTKSVEKNVSFLILVSFSNNLYFICLQLLHSIEPFQSTPKMVYFYVSFSHLLFRTCSVCLTAADVYERSKACITTLFAVPSSSYNIEIQRMTIQVAFENLTLTGCKFFSVTRTFMLTVAGTIATYEIVLVQFSHLSPGTEDSSRIINCTED